MAPVLSAFEAFLKEKRHGGGDLQIGEDIGQLDMVACASPYCGPQWLGGTSQGVNTVISNSVHKNARAIKQFVQTCSAILFLVGQASWNMFQRSFGHLIRSRLDAADASRRWTIYPATDDYSARVSPGIFDKDRRWGICALDPTGDYTAFSYNENFVPRFRMSPQAFEAFETHYPLAAEFKGSANQFWETPRKLRGGMERDAAAVATELKQKYPTAAAELRLDLYDPHAMMTAVPKNMYGKELSYIESKDGGSGS
jgi:hypothetical protein